MASSGGIPVVLYHHSHVIACIIIIIQLIIINHNGRLKMQGLTPHHSIEWSLTLHRSLGQRMFHNSSSVKSLSGVESKYIF